MRRARIVTNPNEMRKIYPNLSLDADSNDLFCPKCGALKQVKKPIDWPKYWEDMDRFSEEHKECK